MVQVIHYPLPTTPAFFITSPLCTITCHHQSTIALHCYHLCSPIQVGVTLHASCYVDTPRALLGGVYDKFRTFTFIIKHDSRRHNKTHWRTARPRTQNRNVAHSDDTQRTRHPQMQRSKTTANRLRRIASRHMELASAEAATHMSLRRPCEDVGILLEGALRSAIR